MRQKLLIHTIRVLIALLFVFTGGFLLLIFRPTVVVDTVYWLNPGVCGKQDAHSGFATLLSYEGLREQMRRQVRLVGSEGGYRLWDSPQGRFWLPESDAGLLPSLLAEQAAQIYGTGGLGVRAGDTVENLECLRPNFAGEIAAGRVIVYPKGVWNREDTLVLWHSAKHWPEPRARCGAIGRGWRWQPTTWKGTRR